MTFPPFLEWMRRFGDVSSNRVSITIPPEQQDKRLADRLISELPVILQWAMEGCIEWRKIGLAPPASVLQSTQEYRKDNDLIGQWIEVRLLP